MPELAHALWLPVFLISLSMLAWWIYNFRRYRQYAKLSGHGAAVHGVITAIHVPAGGARAGRAKFRYRFLTAMGTEIISALKEIPVLMRSQEEQDIIEVIYLPENPDVNHMAQDMKRHLRGLYFGLYMPLVYWLVLTTPLLVSWLVYQAQR